MESQYHQFGSSDNGSVRAEHRMTPQTGKTSCDFDSVTSDVVLKCEKSSVRVRRCEEDHGLCPLRSPGAAAVNPADGHWGKMYEFKHEAESLTRFFSYC